MIELEKGGVYVAARVRAGYSSRGPWELVAVRPAERTHQELTLFSPSGQTGIHEGQRFRVEEILSVKLKKRQDAEGNWSKQDVSVVAKWMPLADEEPEEPGNDPFGLNMPEEDPYTFGV